jgi:Mg-chelatase subunit ChlD
MRFTAPLFLLLLLLLPVFAWLGWPARGVGRRREMLALGLRLLIVACLVLSLAGLEWLQFSNRLAVVYLLDESDSISPGVRAAEMEYVRRSVAGMGPDDQAALVAFGGNALVERSMSSEREIGPLTSRPYPGQTDLAEAIRLGMALFPANATKRMVILSDGMSTTGVPLTTARLAVESGIQIVTVPVGSSPENETLVTAVEAPQFLQQNEHFDLQFSVYATTSTRANVRVLAGGQVLYEGSQELKSGNQSLSLPLVAGQTGFTRYEVQVEPQADTWYQNNSLGTFSQVSGPQRVLLVAPPAGEVLRSGEVRPDEAKALEQALRAANYTVERVDPSGLPSDMVSIASYTSVVLVDIPARQLNPRQLQTIQSYVRDLGGGLLVVGGPTSYGVGGYFKTPLEETLPVEMQIKDEKRRPSLAMVFIIDRSGSMSLTSGGVTKLDLAKEAVIRSLELLTPIDRAGVITFDENAAWVVPMTDLSNLGAIQSAVGTLRSGGGTDILAGVQAMAAVLPGETATVKHVILLTDGGADRTGIPELVKRLHDENGITLTTVGIGNDAAAYLPDLATQGGGNYYYTTDPSGIPSIFTEETSLASRSYIVEHPFFPKQANPSTILSGITELPQLQGYVGTSAKRTAQTLLVSDLDDPILAAWQYGLGHAVAFTSDASGRWAQEWLGWGKFNAFWAQVVRYTMRDRAPSTLDVRVETQGESARLFVDAQREGGDYLNGYNLQVRVIGADGSVQVVDLQQVAPGQYTAPFNPGTPGAYLFSISGTPPQGSEGQGSVAENAGWALSYSPEYRNLQGDRRTLEKISALSNGAPLSIDSSGAEIFRHDLPPARSASPAWPGLLTLAALLLPFDIAVRRLLLGPKDAHRLLDNLRARLRPAAPAEVQHSAGMTTLLQTKQRVNENLAPVISEKQMPGLPVAPASEPKPAPQPAPVPQSPPPTLARDDSSSTSTVNSLLSAKRNRRPGEKEPQ